jgi:hypothetical protein
MDECAIKDRRNLWFLPFSTLASAECPPGYRKNRMRRAMASSAAILAIINREVRQMVVKKIASLFMALPFFCFGCAADTGLQEELVSAGPVISIDVDNKTKLAYLQNVKNSIKSYDQIILDIKNYHRKTNFKELAEEIENYVDTHVNEILIETQSNSSVETQVEIAKIHLLVIRLYINIGHKIKSLEYLKLFNDHYGRDTYLLEKSLNPRDIGYSTLGQGIKILEERANKGITPVVHGKMYPWKISRGKHYPFRDPKM